MGDLPFEEDSFDVLWSEGAVYNIGFETGIRDWRKYLKSGGTLVVSELTC
ncbi:probable transcription regulator [Vibrio ishigakensis]|uniref:Probable transcription regulator n=1 Tax=Vibrio ishigakensis TaxID=1481914 RepID=A0A0B8P190_9VIBR|nr:probable transcription regulator [Vibrio ishigakensis]